MGSDAASSPKTSALHSQQLAQQQQAKAAAHLQKLDDAFVQRAKIDDPKLKGDPEFNNMPRSEQANYARMQAAENIAVSRKMDLLRDEQGAKSIEVDAVTRQVTIKGPLPKYAALVPQTELSKISNEVSEAMKRDAGTYSPGELVRRAKEHAAERLVWESAVQMKPGALMQNYEEVRAQQDEVIARYERVMTHLGHGTEQGDKTRAAYYTEAREALVGYIVEGAGRGIQPIDDRHGTPRRDYNRALAEYVEERDKSVKIVFNKYHRQAEKDAVSGAEIKTEFAQENPQKYREILAKIANSINEQVASDERRGTTVPEHKIEGDFKTAYLREEFNSYVAMSPDGMLVKMYENIKLGVPEEALREAQAWGSER